MDTLAVQAAVQGLSHQALDPRYVHRVQQAPSLRIPPLSLVLPVVAALLVFKARQHAVCACRGIQAVWAGQVRMSLVLLVNPVRYRLLWTA